MPATLYRGMRISTPPHGRQRMQTYQILDSSTGRAGCGRVHQHGRGIRFNQQIGRMAHCSLVKGERRIPVEDDLVLACRVHKWVQETAFLSPIDREVVDMDEH